MINEDSNNQIANIEERLGKYFLIRSKSQPDLVLEIKDKSDRSHNLVVVGLLQIEANAQDHQLWFWDHLTSTIRSKLNAYCITINAQDELVVQHFMNSSNQQWDLQQDGVIIEKEFENVFTLKDSDLRPGASCIVSPYEGLVGQLWKLTYLPAVYFFIRNKLTNKVLDIRGESDSVGAQLIVYNQKSSHDDNQLWYEDQFGLIHSKMHDYIINVLDNDLVMYPYNNNTKQQQWVINGGVIQNRKRPNHVLDVKQVKFQSHDNVIWSEYNSSKSQDWSFENVSLNAYAFDHDGKGRYFLIHQSYFEVVLMVKDERIMARTSPPYDVGLSKLKLLENGRFADDQLFFIDYGAGIIRSKLNDKLCLEAKESYIYLNDYVLGNENQQFILDGNKIYLKYDKSNILTIGTSDEKTLPTEMQCYLAEDYNSHHQMWNLRYGTGSTFYIIAKLSGKIMEARRDNPFNSCTVGLVERKVNTRSANQLWYEDEIGLIRSKLNGFVLDSSYGALHTDRFNSLNPNQGWIIVKEHIKNKHDGKVIDVAAQKSWLSSSIGAAENDYSDNQRWIFTYV